MNLFQFQKANPDYKVVKTGSVELGYAGSNIWGIYSLTDTGHMELTWKEPHDESRFCDITGEVYNIFLN